LLFRNRQQKTLLWGRRFVASNCWLARYRFGPMEWLWRGMT